MNDTDLTKEGIKNLEDRLKDYSTRAKLPPDTVLKKALRDASLTINHLNKSSYIKASVYLEDKNMDGLTRQEAGALFNRCVSLSNGMLCVFCGLRSKCKEMRTLGNTTADAYKEASDKEVKEASSIIGGLAEKSLNGDNDAENELTSKNLAMNALNKAKENLSKGE